MILSGNNLYFEEGEVSTVDNIPVANWLVRFDEMKGRYYLEKMDSFTLPDKIYGNSDTLADRYLETFNKYEKNLGVALTGLKGTGKSLLAKSIAVKSNLPVILVDQPHRGSIFNSFIANISQRCVVFIDEFEKLYHRGDEQQQLLSLLDGMFMGNKLFVFTSNETSKYSNHLLNRPGRIHYMKTFDRIDDDTLNDIIECTLENQNDKNKLVEIINLIDDANVDMVLSLIREMNDYRETADVAVKYLNISLTSFAQFDIHLTDSGLRWEGTVDRNPLVTGSLDSWLVLDKIANRKAGITEERIEQLYQEGRGENHFDYKMDRFTITPASKNGVTKLVHKDDPSISMTISRQKPVRYVF